MKKNEKYMEKLKMQSADVAERNIELLGQLFPDCLTECKNEAGQTFRAIDFDKLRQEVACDVVEGADERYQFTWPDKRKAVRMANTPTSKTLRPCREESVDFDNTENLYIEGDNLEVLKLLRENYLGKVKMIYIDPPYNTGNDFVYNDEFAQGKAEFDAQSGLFDDEGRRMVDPMVQNTESNGRFHTDWLNMIYPRLKVAKDLLSDDGVIFISIDDNEVGNLRKVCDEIFGEHNFVSIINWRRSGGRQDSKYYAVVHEYIICYAKNISNFEAGEEIKQGEVYPKYDEDKKRYYKTQLLRKWGSNSLRENRPNLYYPIEGPNGEEIYPIIYQESEESDLGFVKIQGRWRWGASNLANAHKEGRIEFQKNKWGEWVAYEKIFAPLEGEENTKKYTTWVDDVSNGTDTIKSLFSKTIFDYSKSAELIIRFLKMANLEAEDICLDFFSGSATTAHAVMQLNAEDGGKRKFIMVQLPEKTDPKSEAYKAGYKNICEIGKERIRRAGRKIVEDNAGKEGIEHLDTGFRVLKLDESNMKDVYYTPADTPVQNTLAFDALVDNIREGRTAEDLLFQVLPECNLPLSSRIEEREIHGKHVFVVADGYLVACFDRDINEAVITTIAKMRPYYFVMCDRSVATDNVADNFDQIFNAYSKETIRKIL